VKEMKLDHRYSFDDISQANLVSGELFLFFANSIVYFQPTQIGTKRFIEDFKANQDRFPLA
jgi:hypothetical protein